MNPDKIYNNQLNCTEKSAKLNPKSVSRQNKTKKKLCEGPKNYPSLENLHKKRSTELTLCMPAFHLHALNDNRNI